jgi:hypothetical protein
MANEVWPDEAIDRLLLWLAEAPAHGVAMANWWTFHYVDSEGVLSEFEGADGYRWQTGGYADPSDPVAVSIRDWWMDSEHASLLRRSLVDLTSGMPNWDTW